MARSDPELWQRLAAFEVGPPGKMFCFAKRLARENRWSLEFANRVFDEYRRFLYLCAVARRPLTPSDAVGQTWQLHLAYPESYGQVLCRGVLGQRLRYAPPGGIQEPGGRAASYRATLAAYEQEFGCAPPAEIWPQLAAKPTKPTQPPRPRRAGRKTQKLRPALMPAAG